MAGAALSRHNPFASRQSGKLQAHACILSSFLLSPEPFKVQGNHMMTKNPIKPHRAILTVDRGMPRC